MVMQIYTEVDQGNAQMQNVLNYTKIVSSIDKDLIKLEDTISSLNNIQMKTAKKVGEALEREIQALNGMLLIVDNATHEILKATCMAKPKVLTRSRLLENPNFQKLLEIHRELGDECTYHQKPLTEDEVAGFSVALKDAIDKVKQIKAQSMKQELSILQNEQNELLRPFTEKKEYLKDMRKQVVHTFMKSSRELDNYEHEQKIWGETAVKFPEYSRVYDKIQAGLTANQGNLATDVMVIKLSKSATNLLESLNIN